MGKIIAVGDLHGDWGSLNQLINKKSPEVILQVGDFGWWPKMDIGKPVLYTHQKHWSHKGVKCHDTDVYWCDGNHEDHESLLAGEGCYDRVIYMPRGKTTRLPDGRKVLFFGGAQSVDKDERIWGVDWFPQEVPSYSEALDCITSSRRMGKVDIIVSHTCPHEFDVTGKEWKLADPTRGCLSALLEAFEPDLWLFGHWHKYQQGQYKNTKWICLDYPCHGGRWWEEV